MPETTSQATGITISIPFQVLEALRAELPEDRRRELLREHTGTNSPKAEWVWREAIMPWAAEQLGYDPEAVELTVDGDFQPTQPRDEDGTFGNKDDE